MAERLPGGPQRNAPERPNPYPRTPTVRAAAAILDNRRAVAKYSNRRLITEEGRFDSEREYRRWQDLKLLEKAGELCNLRRQVSFDIHVNGHKVCRYVADFIYTDRSGKICEDVKGYRTQLYLLKKKLMKACHGIEIKEI